MSLLQRVIARCVLRLERSVSTDVNCDITVENEGTAPNPQALLTVLTTEHFTLQGARAVHHERQLDPSGVVRRLRFERPGRTGLLRNCTIQHHPILLLTAITSSCPDGCSLCMEEIDQS